MTVYFPDEPTPADDSLAPLILVEATRSDPREVIRVISDHLISDEPVWVPIVLRLSRPLTAGEEIALQEQDRIRRANDAYGSLVLAVDREIEPEDVPALIKGIETRGAEIDAMILAAHERAEDFKTRLNANRGK